MEIDSEEFQEAVKHTQEMIAFARAATEEGQKMAHDHVIALCEEVVTVIKKNVLEPFQALYILKICIDSIVKTIQDRVEETKILKN